MEEYQIHLNPMIPHRYGAKEREEIRKKEKEIMSGTSRKLELTEYKFLILFLTTYIAKGNIPIIRRDDLENTLVKYYYNPDYKFLFEDIIPTRTRIDEEKSLNLSDSFLNALAYGVITLIHNGSVHTKYIINIDSEEVPEIYEEYTERQINAMNNIVSESFAPVKEISNESKPKVKEKTINNQ